MIAWRLSEAKMTEWLFSELPHKTYAAESITMHEQQGNGGQRGLQHGR